MFYPAFQSMILQNTHVQTVSGTFCDSRILLRIGHKVENKGSEVHDQKTVVSGWEINIDCSNAMISIS